MLSQPNLSNLSPYNHSYGTRYLSHIFPFIPAHSPVTVTPWLPLKNFLFYFFGQWLVTDRVFVNLISEVPWLVVVLSSIRHFSSFLPKYFLTLLWFLKWSALKVLENLFKKILFSNWFWITKNPISGTYPMCHYKSVNWRALLWFLNNFLLVFRNY